MKQTKFIKFLKNEAGQALNRYHSLLVILLVVSLILSVLLYNGIGFIKSKYRAGEIAKKTIIAEKGFRYINEKATNTLLKGKIDKSAPVYLYYPEIRDSVLRRIDKAFSQARSFNENIRSSRGNEVQQGSNINQSEGIFTSALGVSLDKKTLDGFYYNNYNGNIESHVIKIVKQIYKKGVLSEPPNNNLGIEIRNTITNESKLAGYSDIFFTPRRVNSFSYYYARKFLGFMPAYLQADIYRFVGAVVKPNIIYSKYLTLQKIEDIKAETTPIYNNVDKGTLIVKSGDLLTKSKALELNTYESRFYLGNNIPSIMGLFLMISILLLVSYIFPYKYIRKFRTTVDFKNIIFIISILIFSIIVIKIGIIFANAFSIYFPFISKSDIYYLIPFAFGPMLVRIMLNSEVSVVYIAVFSILTSIIFKNSIFFMIYSFVGSFIASYEVFDFSSWARIFRAGIITGILNIFIVISFSFIGFSFVNVQNIYNIIFAFGSGIISSLMVVALIPLIERVFDYTTDFKLLEVSNTNFPLLKQLSISAPGTYQHSMIVAALSEAASSAIGANPLLSRVGSLYHDIGKILKPNYYIENISPQENPHDRLNPTMSSLIISSHVKDGQELSRKYKLGSRVENIISQHHGTSMIGSFFEKASKEKGNSMVSESAFRYSGKKPQSKEAGIIMLADSVEAISRTMTNISPSRIEQMVKRTINRIYTDGQLDESEITLKDLHAIGDSFVKVLNTIFHQRIPYDKYYEPSEKTENRSKISPLYR